MIDILAAILPAIVLCGQFIAPPHQPHVGTPAWVADAPCGAVSADIPEPEGPSDRTLKESDQQGLEWRSSPADITASSVAAFNAAAECGCPTESAPYRLAPKQGPPA